MAENGQRISLPTPVLGALIALFVWLAGGTLAGVWLVATMNANVQNLSNTMTQYQIRAEAEKKAENDRHDAETRQLKEQLELQSLKLADLREKQIRSEARRN